MRPFADTFDRGVSLLQCWVGIRAKFSEVFSMGKALLAVLRSGSYAAAHFDGQLVLRDPTGLANPVRPDSPNS